MKNQILVTGFATGMVLSIGLGPHRAIAASFSGLYVFGDSLSDTDNFFRTTEVLTGTGLPPFPYAPGRFSNGPIWVDYLAEALGLMPTPFADVMFAGATPTQGINFAFGGATTGSANTIFPLLPGLEQQIDQFASLLPSGQAADSNALYILWAGGNDYLPGESNFVPLTTPELPIANLSAAISDLLNVGARNFLVVNQPPLGQLPLTRTTPLAEPLNRLSSAHNAALDATLDTLSAANLDSKIATLDINALFNRAIASEFGFTNTTDACFQLSTFSVCDTPETFLFWDLTHPTTTTHKLVSNTALETLNAQHEPPTSVPEPVVSLGILTFGVMGARMGARMRRK